MNTFKKYVVHHHYEIVIFGGNHLKGIRFSTKNNNTQRPSNHIQTNVSSQNVPPIFPEDFFNRRNSIYPIHFCEGRRIEAKMAQTTPTLAEVQFAKTIEICKRFVMKANNGVMTTKN